MQQLDSFYETAIKRGHHIEGKPLIVAEWNFNNIYEPTVTNTPDDQNWSYGNKYFPVKSVSNSIRPKASGIFAAFTEDASTTSTATLGVDGKRYYTTGSDPDKVFTYWICPTISDLNKVGSGPTGEDDPSLPEHYGVSRGTVLVEYPEYVKSNKVRVLFNVGPLPVDWSIFLHTQGAPGDGYVEIENPTVDTITGKAEIWWDGADWVEDQQLEEPIYAVIDKVKVEVRAVNQPNKYLQIVEIAAGREIDLTARVQEYNVNYQMDDVDFITPVGRLVSADGRITFNNTDLKINEQVDSDFAGLLKGRCEYRTYVVYDLSDYSGSEVIMRTGTLFANDWQQMNEYEYQVEMWDLLKLLQITKLPGRLFENMSLARIVSQILDSVGVDSYNLDPDDFDDSSIVKYFWASGDETVFDVLDHLCKSYQAAIYVDEFGVVQLLTRTQIANEDDDPVWTFKGEQVGLDIADIQTLQKKYSLQANTVTIKYNEKEAKVDATDVTQQPLTSKIWEATDTVVLRASPLTRDLSADGSYDFPTWERDVWIDAVQSATWPFKGKVNVDGELIEYDGKGYQKWNYSTTPPTVQEVLVHSTEEKLAADKETYQTWTPTGLTTPGGISGDPTQQNRYTGRLFTTKRDASGGRQAAHYTHWNDGWMGMRASTFAPVNASFPTRYVDPGGTTYNMANIKNYKTRPGWTTFQNRWSVEGSVLKCNNTADGDVNSSVLVRDVGSVECREFGTRLRLSGTEHSVGGLIFYMSNATGYDDSGSTLTDPLLATRWYQLTITTTEMVDKYGRGAVPNEICLEVKNGNTVAKMASTRSLGWGGPAVGSDGTWTINANTWYDVDIVVKDAAVEGQDFAGTQATQVEVYIDGQWVDTWTTTDNIRPTAWMGVHSRQKSVSEFEYFYATSAKTNVNPGFINDDNFDARTFQLAGGTNVSTTFNLTPSNASNGYQSILSFSTIGSDATISSLKVKGGLNSTYTITKQVGPLLVKPNTRVIVDLDSTVDFPVAVDITYTSTNELSMCWETTMEQNFPYNNEGYITPPAHSFYDMSKGGYLSNKQSYLSMDKPLYPVFTEGTTVIDGRFLFSDDFGAVVHEVRDFEVDYDVMPAKGVRVYMSNNKIRVVSHTYNPEKGIFTLANASNRDEIVNGTEEIDEQNSIDHVLMLYGYILEDKGEKTKEVKDNNSVRRYGPISINVDADWVFNEAEAEVLGDWIIEHWSDPMDTVSLEVFSNTFTQIGDKVNIVYANANILSDWLYIVSERSVNFDSDGMSTSVTLRRVR